MDLFSVPVTDVRPLLKAERQDLLHLVRGLSPQEWTAPSAAPGWTVKDLALHLLDDDLGWLSRGRDGDRAGTLAMDDHDTFVAALASKNHSWIAGAQGLSRRVVADLLEWSGHQMDAYYASLDLLSLGRVSWAADGAVPLWFDVAQDLTERWVHQMQMRQAVGRVGDFLDRYLPVVLRTFAWALPHQYRVPAASGTTVQVDLASGGTWHLLSDGTARWSLEVGGVDVPDATATFSDDAAWRWLTGASIPPDSVRLGGRAELCEPLLSVRGILV